MPLNRKALVTRRLRLEPIDRSHADSLFKLFQEPSMHTFTERTGPDDLVQFRRDCEFLESDKSPDGTKWWLNWVSFDQTSNTIVGKIELSIELDTGEGYLAYYSFAGCEGQGFASEASRMIISNAFSNYNIHKIIIEIDLRNESSLRVANAIGARFVRIRPPEYTEDHDQKVFEFMEQDLPNLGEFI